MEEQDTIDLRQIGQIIAKYKYRLFSIVAVTTAIAIAVAFILPKEYESTTLIRAKQTQGSGISMQAGAAVALLGGSAPSAVQSYIEMMKSRAVLQPVIDEIEWPEEPPQADEFAKKFLELKNAKGTDLIEVRAKGRSQEEAQMIALDVSGNFKDLLTKQNQDQQSIMVKFLTERLSVAKTDMEKAEQDLENFRQKSKVYVPDEQVKAYIKKISDIDQKLAEVQVQNEADQAKLTDLTDQLGRQNAALAQYNLSDNPEIGKIRSAIIEKQLALVGLQQKYTEKHPSVVTTRKELAELNKTLRSEVEKAVVSGTMTMNPVQGGLLKDKVLTETELAVGQASVEALRKVQSDSEREISNLSANSMTYIGLERQAKIAQEVYGVLVKNLEQAKIQQAMESMDIQIVDEANLPVKPSDPKKTLIAMIGLILGVIISFGYVAVFYMRR